MQITHNISPATHYAPSHRSKQIYMSDNGDVFEFHFYNTSYFHPDAHYALRPALKRGFEVEQM